MSSEETAFLKERTKIFLIVLVFLGCYFLPFSHPKVTAATGEAFRMLQEYARKHVLTCLVPAFFIAGAIACFVSKTAVLKYFGRDAKKWISYSLASVSGAVLAVCSCTVLPLFGGIYKRGAGIGPATAFLYSGPAINILAIILSARVLGLDIGLARAVAAISFSVIIGLIMAGLFEHSRNTKDGGDPALIASSPTAERPLWKTGVQFLLLILILIFAAWGKPKGVVGFAAALYKIHWFAVAFLLLILVPVLYFWFKKDELREWVASTWDFAKQILPLLFIGVLAAGFLYALLPREYVIKLVGGNSVKANFFASIVGALMYFATLTEVPIVQGLIKLGMGKGPALALLLAGPALSLPNMLVIRSIMGNKQTLVYICLVVILSTTAGLIFGSFYGF